MRSKNKKRGGKDLNLYKKDSRRWGKSYRNPEK